MGEESTIKQEGKKCNPKGGKQKFRPIIKSTYKSNIEYLDDSTYTCGYTSDADKFKESTKVITRYVIRK